MSNKDKLTVMGLLISLAEAVLITVAVLALCVCAGVA